MDPHPPESLEEQVGELRSRVGQLEQTLQAYGIVVEPARPHPPEARAPIPSAPQPGQAVPEPPAAHPAPPSSTFPAQPLPVPPPLFASASSATPYDTRSFESRVGSQWFNRIGILAILIGMAWFLKLAIDNHWIGPLGRILIGLIAGVGLVVWSERFRTKGYTAFAYSLKAAGSGTLYLSLWAAFSLYHLVPAPVAFLAMIAVTAFNGYLAWVQDAELLALYAIVGGLSSPLLVSTGENHEVTLFSYLLMIDLAVLILVILRPWSRLLFGAFLGTVLFVFGWWAAFYTQAQLGRTAFFLACFFLIFAFAPRLVRLRIPADTGASLWDHLAMVVLPVANAALGFFAFYQLFDQATIDWAGPWLAVAFAAFYLLLLRLRATQRLHDSPLVLSSLHLSTAVVFLTIAIPLKAHGRWLVIGWLVEGAALLWASTRTRSMLLRVLSMLCLALGLFALLAMNPSASTTPFFNARFGTYCVAIGVFAFILWLAHKAPPEDHQPQSPASWPVIAAMSVLLINGIILLAIGSEIHSFWWNLQGRYDARLMYRYQMYAQFSYSAFFMAFGAVLLAIGFWRRSAFLRWQALVLLAISIGKVFLLDISSLSEGYRILSFLGLGALLLAVSFVYQRDWLNLRSHGGQTT
jgi:uncharacterized membrane protein